MTAATAPLSTDSVESDDADEPRGRGRRPFKPTAEQRLLVIGMAAVGVRHEFICTRIRWPIGGCIDPKTLRRAFRAELDGGMAEATQAVANALFQNAVGNGNVAAQIFWLKNRAPDQWKERTEHLHGGEVRTAITITGDSPEAEL